MTKNKTALVLGATGGIGGTLARGLVARGWTVRALHRDPARLAASTGISWIQGDALSADDVRRAAEGVSVIVHAVNPPGYRNWQKLVLPMIDNSIAAAKAEGARIVLPGTIYNYGPDAFPVLTEASPQNPATRKGGIRAELERRLQAATLEGAAVLIVRAGDYFGPRAGNNWFSQALVTPRQRIAAITYPGKAGIGHQWAYLPDVAETMLALLDRRDELAPFAVFHMDGHWDADGTAMNAAIRRAAGDPALKIKAMPWLLLRLIGFFNPTLREMMELRYLWRIPVRLDNAKLLGLLGQEPRTPLDQAVRATLEDLHCL